MDVTFVAIAFAAVFGGLLVASRMAAWVALLILTFRPPPSCPSAARPIRPATVIVPLLFHSGPWSLALAVAGISFAVHSARPATAWAACGGFGLGVALVAGVTLLAVWRQRHPRPEPPPLTPERLLALKRRFFWRNGILAGIGGPILFSYVTWGTLWHGPGFFLGVFLVSFAGAWMWSWFMWQWLSGALLSAEKARQRRRQQSAA